jgi:DNA-binding NarL/FixJ family response regulator
MRCLIIDDDESPRRLMELIVTRSGHRALAVGAFREAIEALRRETFDVAIVDMEMPDASGETAIGILRAYDPGLKVLVVSGYGDRRRVLAALDAGADGYLLKDEVGESLAASLQDVRAGNTPLSPRVASIVLRQLRFWRLAEGTNGAQPVARIRLGPDPGADD